VYDVKGIAAFEIREIREFQPGIPLPSWLNFSCSSLRTREVLLPNWAIHINRANSVACHKFWQELLDLGRKIEKPRVRRSDKGVFVKTEMLF